MQVHIGAQRGAHRPLNLAALRELSDAIGGAIFVRRAFAINRDAFASGMRAAGVPTPGAVAPEARQAPADADAPWPTNDADVKALTELDARSADDKAVLLSWALDAWTLVDAEVQRLFSAMMHSLGLFRRFRISPVDFAAFISDVATHYNANPCVPSILLVRCIASRADFPLSPTNAPPQVS